MGHQDPNKTSYESRCEDDVWPRDQSEGEASKDNCESLPSGRAEETNLRKCIMTARCVFPEVHSPWESHGAGLGDACLTRGRLDFAHCTSIAVWPIQFGK